MSEENEVVNVTEDPAPAGKKTRAKKDGAPKAEKPKAPKPLYYVADNANRGTTIYGQIQKVIFENPGLDDDALFPLLVAGVTSSKNEKTKKFFAGYLSGGLRRGNLTNDPSKAVSALPVKTEVVREKKEKVAGAPTEVGSTVIAALESVIKEHDAPRTQPISSATLSEKLGKPLSGYARVFKKLEKDGYLVLVMSEDNKSIATVALTDKMPPTASSPTSEPEVTVS